MKRALCQMHLSVANDFPVASHCPFPRHKLSNITQSCDKETQSSKVIYFLPGSQGELLTQLVFSFQLLLFTYWYSLTPVDLLLLKYCYFHDFYLNRHTGLLIKKQETFLWQNPIKQTSHVHINCKSSFMWSSERYLFVYRVLRSLKEYE